MDSFENEKISGSINIDEPRWDQSTYSGRAKHFFATTNPLNLLCTSQQLERAKEIVINYRNGEGQFDLSEDEIWKAKQFYDSAFHPDTGEKMFIVGRMSAQVPMSTTIAVCMLTFYKSTMEVVFWQWFNQSFNAIVNYTNRSGATPINRRQLGTCYVLATGGAMATAFGLNKLVKRSPPLLARFVPFGAVAAANCVNIPMMRAKEITDGLAVFDQDGNQIGESKIAAKRGITSVVFSRILMVSPGMVLPPIIMDRLERKGILARYPLIGTPVQAIVCGLTLIFATPMCCALFPQKSSISVSKLEPEIQERCRNLSTSPSVLFYNKGL